jgi:(E)-4-hydroxy-3-methylbut-2-enyl-diphosphate synthase
MNGRHTRSVRIGSVTIGGGATVVVQSMCATKTADVEATATQIEQLAAAGAGVVRVAVDTPRDAEALREIRHRTRANLSVDLQENYRLAADVAPWVDKIRYNPGHLHHHQRQRPWQDKVRFLVDVAGEHNCAIRIGVNCGSVDPAKQVSPLPLGEHQTLSPLPLGEGSGVRAATSGQWPVGSGQREVGSGQWAVGSEAEGPRPPSSGPRPPALLDAMLASALEHCELLDQLGFTRYCVSLKDSDPAAVVEVNRRFAAHRPDVPLHLGVTEAGMPPEGIWKTRRAFEPLLAAGIGDTLRVSLTVPVARKHEEIAAGLQILADVAAGKRGQNYFSAEGGQSSGWAAKNSSDPFFGGLNIISCPSCSRVQNEAFVELAQRVREATRYAATYPITIAVMGCRVNGPGETDHADLGLWCGPDAVHLKRGGESLGAFSFDEVIARLKVELDRLIAARFAVPSPTGRGPG